MEQTARPKANACTNATHLALVLKNRKKCPECSRVLFTIPDWKCPRCSVDRNSCTCEGGSWIGENILEFAGGEEALKALNLAGKLKKLTQVAEFLEANPRLAQAAHIGGNILRSGAVGAVQGGVKGAAEGDATAGAVGGGIGGLAGGTTGEVFSGLGNPSR